MAREKPLEPGTKCWYFWHGLLSIATVEDARERGYGTGYGIKFESGLQSCTHDVAIDEMLFKFPEDKDALLSTISAEIETMRLYMGMVICERTCL